jgi:hypothetical protein
VYKLNVGLFYTPKFPAKPHFYHKFPRFSVATFVYIKPRFFLDSLCMGNLYVYSDFAPSPTLSAASNGQFMALSNDNTMFFQVNLRLTNYPLTIYFLFERGVPYEIIYLNEVGAGAIVGGDGGYGVGWRGGGARGCGKRRLHFA